MSADWTKSYQYWSQWSGDDANSDTEILGGAAFKNEKKLQELNGKIISKHSHNHTDEKSFYEKSEKEKLDICSCHHLLGDYLSHEGDVNGAIEQYKLVISYSLYCFPDSEIDQHQMEAIKRDCLCSISLLLRCIGEYRAAADYASRAISDCPNFELAYLHRSQAYRELDEYDRARADLSAYLRLGLSSNVRTTHDRELLILAGKEKHANSKWRTLSVRAFSTTSGSADHVDVSPSAGPSQDVPLPSLPTLLNRGMLLEPAIDF